MALLVEEVLVAGISILLAVAAIVGNIMILIIIVRSKSMRTPMNYLIANLAILDAMTGLFAIPNAILERSFSGQTTLLAAIVNSTSESVGDVLCKAKGAVWIGTVGSPAFLMFIAFERFMAVMYPFSRKGGITRRRLRWITPCCYLFTVTIPFPYYVMVRYRARLQKCNDTAYSGFNSRAYSITCLLALFLIPSATMTVLYVQVAKKLWRNQPVNDSNNISVARLKANRNVIRAVFTITAMYILCWGFIYVIYFIGHFFEQVRLWSTFYECSIMAACLNSAVNPALYCVYISGFRRHFLRIFERCRNCSQRQEHTLSINIIQQNSIETPQGNNQISLVDFRNQFSFPVGVGCPELPARRGIK